MLCRYERNLIFKSDKGLHLLSYSTEDQSVPKVAQTDRSNMTTTTSLQSAIISWLPMQWR